MSFLHHTPKAVDVDNVRPPRCAIAHLGLYRQPQSPTAYWASLVCSWYQWVMTCPTRRQLFDTCCHVASIRCCNATTNSCTVCGSSSLDDCPSMFFVPINIPTPSYYPGVSQS
ncbi:hypothetical protein E2C01_039775 [Portunus trituberculatus]|uniref:Uncharacterized protein n=1 Tax=Portunus trituberculatus TaxID=210409 RepID=A0A5B7FL19_PORTR|nr:hypothetical protein [Portunus trituberculatus]